MVVCKDYNITDISVALTEFGIDQPRYILLILKLKVQCHVSEIITVRLPMFIYTDMLYSLVRVEQSSLHLPQI